MILEVVQRIADAGTIEEFDRQCRDNQATHRVAEHLAATIAAAHDIPFIEAMTRLFQTRIDLTTALGSPEGWATLANLVAADLQAGVAASIIPTVH